jgi:tetratricopeptide (TPR) repeat protein
MKTGVSHRVALSVLLIIIGFASSEVWGQAKAWRGTITIPTYPWEDDVNPKFWALEGTAKLSTTGTGSIVYPYTMQDHLSRTKVDRTYKAVFLENEYLKVTCLPELGGRLHSVFDKTTGQEMFHKNNVIKPGMIGMRGAWISGGVEWNSGPHGHTVTIVSPVDVFEGQDQDGSFIEIANTEKIFRTRWTVRVTLHPGKAYLDERISIVNPTDGVHPYYFWNCTAFPNKPGTRFIYPMTLGTDHSAREFFTWPIHKGKDLTWLKNYEIYTSVFAYQCVYDFFGAYDVDADRGIVSAANHFKVPGKKAWTWGEWEFGKMAQKNLTDDDGPYIEVQSGPLPTQSDYGLLGPREEVSWREYWYPVHGLGQGFEFATEDVAIQTSRKDGRLELRLLATGEFPGASCILSRDGNELLRKRIDLSPAAPQVVTLSSAGILPVSSPATGETPGLPPVQVSVKDSHGESLAAFTTPLPIPKVSPPDPSKFAEKPDDQCSVEELHYKGRKFDRDTNRLRAREYYGKALAKDPGHVASLRALAILDVESALYQDAVKRLEKAVDRDPDDGMSWYFLGVAHLGLKNNNEALRCGYQAVRCFGTGDLGYRVAGRARLRMEKLPTDDKARHDALVAFGWEHPREIPSFVFEWDLMQDFFASVFSSQNIRSVQRGVHSRVAYLGEREFEMLECALALADYGLFKEAAQVVSAACVDGVPEADLRPLPLYYLAYFASQQGDAAKAKEYLQRAAKIDKDFVFPSRPEEVEILRYAVEKNPSDANAHLHLGNLYANLGRLDEAVQEWEKCVAMAPAKAMALRNLGLFASSKGDLPKAESLYRKAAAARPSDQTLFRDLAELLIAAGKRPEAIRVMETMPVGKMRRAEITIALAQAYCDEKRWDDAVKLLESTPYFVNWEGQDVTWRLFNRAHVERGRQLFDKKNYQAALKDFEAALTYPANLNVGRSNRPPEAQAQYWRGRALQALGRTDEARAAWKAGADGPAGTGGRKRGRGAEGQSDYRELCRKALEKAP